MIATKNGKLSEKSSKNNLYRPEIDGLRGFAVVSVIINHINRDILPGGYLGVDIFFVISGYVITSSLSTRKSEDFKEFIIGFYERRVKRLIPALSTFVIVTSVLICFFNSSPNQSLKTGITSLFGLSNLYLLKQSADYFAQPTEFNFFTHTWSLGVEEQFYIIFPFLIWFSGFSRKCKYGARNLFFLIGFLATLSCISFIYLYPINEAAAYYLLPTRFWEMSIGCLMFVGFEQRSSIKEYLKKVPSVIILILMIGVMYLPKSIASASTIAIVILSSILIACLRKKTIGFRILSDKKVVSIGLISYSLYLWHWGVLVVARWTIGVTRETVIPIVLVIIILSFLSYEFIEKKARRILWSSRKIITVGIGLLISFISSFGIGILATQLNLKLYLGEYKSKDAIQNILPISTFHIFGDSHAEDIYDLLKNNGSFKVKRYSAFTCPFYKEKCRNSSRNISQLISVLEEGDVVIFASNYLHRIKNYKGEASIMIKFLKSTLPSLNSKGAITILKLPHPMVNPPNVATGLICKKEFFRPVLNNNCFVQGIPKISFENDMKNRHPKVENLKKEFPNLLYWDINDITCPESYCFPVTETKQYLQDSNHLFISSPTLSDALIHELNLVLSKQLKK